MTAADAPPIIFVHGTRFSAGQWSSQLAALQADFQVAAVDLPGHGARAAQPWSLNAATEIIASAVDSACSRLSAPVVGIRQVSRSAGGPRRLGPAVVADRLSGVATDARWPTATSGDNLLEDLFGL
ncbi:alpha/beta fold hydrolase [Streptomyces sp. NPDC050255]|uniref:alpha/beta fold hydrolase n=1 Tax=Streptomyces sp. NPDC050255 TaxID=3365606 RepID=UPI003797E2B9